MYKEEEDIRKKKLSSYYAQCFPSTTLPQPHYLRQDLYVINKRFVSFIEDRTENTK